MESDRPQTILNYRSYFVTDPKAKKKPEISGRMFLYKYVLHNSLGGIVNYC